LSTRVKGDVIGKVCKKCSAVNVDSAKFCVNCGSPLDSEFSKGGLSKKSYMVIGSAFVIAVLIVALIQTVNNRALEQKRIAGANKAAMSQKQMSEETKRLHDKIMSLEAEAAQNPHDVTKMTELANSYFDIGNFGRAIKYYEKVLTITPDNPNILIDTGVCYFNLSKNDSAILYLNKALSVEPEHKQGLYNLGIIYYNMKNTAKAVTVWKKLIRIHGNSREADNARKFIEQISKQSKSL